MGPRTLLKLGLVLVIFIAAVLGLHEWQKPKGPDKPYQDINPAEIQMIHLRSLSGNAFSLALQEGIWHLTEPVQTKADQAKVITLLSDIQNLEIDESVSKNPDKQSLYQVDEASGTRIQLMGQGQTTPLAHFYLGKNAGDWNHFYFREHAETSIHLSQGLSPHTINQDLKSWRDRSFVNIPRESVNLMEFVTGKKEFVLTRDEDKWRHKDKEVDPATLTSLLNLTTPLDADDFGAEEDTLESTGLKKPSFSYRLSSGTQTVKASFGDSRDNKTFALREGSSTIYKLYDYKANQIKDKIKELK